MKTLSKFKISTVIAISGLFIASCEDNSEYQELNYQYQVCADQNDWRVNDDECEKPTGATHHGSHFVFLPMNSSYYPGVGQKVEGGSLSPVGSYTVARVPAGGMRGGFGSSAHSYSSHGGIS